MGLVLCLSYSAVIYVGLMGFAKRTPLNDKKYGVAASARPVTWYLVRSSGISQKWCKRALVFAGPVGNVKWERLGSICLINIQSNVRNKHNSLNLL